MKRVIGIVFVFFVVTALSFPSHCKASEPKPEFFGIYMVESGEMSKAELTKEDGRLIYTTGPLFRGFKKIPDNIKKTQDKNLYFILYGKDWDYRNAVLSKLHFVGKKLVKTVTLEWLHPDGETFDINMWLPESNIPLNVAPIKGEENMYKLVPGKPVKDGIYALHFRTLGRHKGIAVTGDSSFVFMMGDVSTKAVSSQSAGQKSKAGAKPGAAAKKEKPLLQTYLEDRRAEKEKLRQGLDGKVLRGWFKIGGSKKYICFLRIIKQEGDNWTGLFVLPPSTASGVKGTFDGENLTLVDTKYISVSKKSRLKPGDPVKNAGKEYVYKLSGAAFEHSSVIDYQGERKKYKVKLEVSEPAEDIKAKYEKGNRLIAGYYREKNGKNHIFTIKVRGNEPILGSLEHHIE